jgi:hypothetical protein
LQVQPRYPARRHCGAPRPTHATGRPCAGPCPTACGTPRPGSALPRPVQRVVQGTHLIPGNSNASAVGGTSRTGTHRAPPLTSARLDEAVALPSPAVVSSARLNRYSDHLRRPSGWLPLPGSSPVIGRHAPAAIRSPLGRGGPLQFPPPLSERSPAPYAGESFTAAHPGSSPLPWPSPFHSGLGTPSAPPLGWVQ